ncbi:GPI ethanolamine phosphate transferase 3 [Drosophila sulfurigaster albostrigata]|uniref:GPI ethanolamine phosphate transferase 3 n=1 Tax=Drosophila sulfurigaster albostrigata TaxID=89887 RepID=UPI002D21AF62|nr:GPI ethanolamine phosphate transferase 3 [Drosophila sulfurigaster albostrigata]
MNFTYLFVLIWLAYLICSGVLLFSRGFLLARVSKTETSSCRRLSLNPNDEYYLTPEVVNEIFKDVNASSSSNLCLPQKSKVIIIVVDALKYEFGLYNESITTEPLPYENKLLTLHRLLQQSPDNARLMRFKADPPTTTLQRLKGLTTGSLPTFIDIGSNFASPEINEDNIIDQIVKTDLPIVFLGDSTWTDLYPRRFKRAYSYPSFDIFDLDSVDNQVMQHLPKELASDDWEVLIAHFLGVDHCGHKHGPIHEEMARKLSEMNDIISSVVANMDNETTLLIMGDHGMTATGDHGGDTDDETNALLFAYSKQHKFYSSADSGSDSEMLQQIDLVPTLATILGAPIPYSNLGLVNFNIVPAVDVPHLNKFQTLLLHAWQNAQQIYRYFFSYAMENKRTFNVEQMESLETEFILLTHRVKSIYNEAAYKSFVRDLNVHLRDILNVCREIWVKFEPTQMSQGLLFSFLPIFFAFLLINNSNASDFEKIFKSKEVFYVYLMNIAAGVFGYRYFKNFSFKTEEHGVIFFTALTSAVLLAFYTLRHWNSIANNWANVKRFGHMPTRLLLFATMAVFFSNSFVVQEAKILSYLLAAVILLLVYELLQLSARLDFKNKFKWSQFWRSTALRLILASVLAICCIRFTYTLFRCREEQGDCADFSTSSPGFSVKRPSMGKTYILAVVIIVLYTTLTRLYLRSCGNLTGNAPNVVLARYGPTVASICAGGHILLANSAIKNIQRTHIDAMALVIYGLLLLQIIVVSWSPLMTFVLPPKNPNSISVNGRDSIVPEIFRKMKRMYEGDDAERRHEIPVVYGLATVYSSIIISFGIFLAMLMVVLLEPRASIGLIVCVVVGAIILSVHGILRYRTANSFESCVQPTFSAVVGWFLLAHFCFFATSHQTTLSQIDWRAAFVGRSSALGQSHLISGALVILNTFCGPIFFYCMYALLSTETFSLFALFPNLIRSSSNGRSNNKPDASTALNDIATEAVGFDMTRGELTLYEYENVFLGAGFKLATQFFMLQGIKIFCAMLACTIHCRHLMVWKIFAPRFIYEALATFVGLPALIVGYLLLLRINRAVDGLIKRINKDK